MLRHTVSGDAIRRYRELRGMSPADLAEAVGISTDYVYKIENGKKQPSAPRTAQFAAALEVDITKLLARTNAPRKAGLRKSA